MKRQLYSPLSISLLTTDCAQNIWTKKPSKKYIRDVSDLLLGTAAHESGGFRYNRQMRFSYTSTRGAWGIWQIESISVKDTLQKLQDRPELDKNCGCWLVQSDRGPRLSELHSAPIDYCRTFPYSPAMCCIFARLHYLFKPGKIPSDITGQAEYWKKWYNTIEGAGTVDQYIKSWNDNVERAN